MFKRLKMSAALVAAAALLSPAAAQPPTAPSRAVPRRRPTSPITGLRFMVPNTAGSGYDTTARAVAKVMDDNERHPQRRGVQPRRCRRHGRAGPDGVGEGQRQAVDDDGSRRGRGAVHQQVRGQARPDHPDRQAHRGVRRHRGGQELAVQDDHRAGGRLEGQPEGPGRGWRLGAGRSRPPAADAAGPDGRHRADGGQLHLLRRRRRPAAGHAGRQGGVRRLRSRGVPRPGGGRRGPGPGHQRAGADGDGRTPRR